MFNKLLLHRLWVLTFIMFALNLQINAQGTGKIIGAVSDASTGDYLPGANVILEGTTIGAATGRSGDYKMENIKPGTYTLKASYLGYKDYTVSVKVVAGKTVQIDVPIEIAAIDMQDVVVKGVRMGQTKALNQQMNSETIVNVMSKEEMEKFPDLNTADVLQRMPGVYVTKSLGSSRFVYIRGTQPRLTSVTVNGQRIASPEDEERFVGLDAINSNQLQSVEVVKALTPDMDADAIGGSVNLVTKSAFDNQATTLRLRAGGGYQVLGSNPLYQFDGTYSTIFGSNKNWGFTVGASYNANNIQAQSNEFDYDDIEDVNGNIIKNALDDYRNYLYNTKRNTIGLNLALEYKIDDYNKYFIRGMYNTLDDIQTRFMTRYRLGKGDYVTPSLISKARMAYEMQDRTEARVINAFSMGGINTLGNVDIDYTLAYSYGAEDRTDPAAYKSEWQLNEKVNFQLDLSDENFPKLTVANTDLDEAYLQNPANWEIDTQDYRSVLTTNDNITADFNFKIPYHFAGNSAYVKAGAKGRFESKDRAGTRIKYKWKGDDNVYMNIASTTDKVDNFLLGNYIFAPIMDRDKYLEFFNANKNQNNALRPTEQLDDNDGAGGDYKAKENVYGGYVMTTVNFDNFMVLIGVRDEYTSTNYNGKELLYSPDGDYLGTKDANNTNSYNFVLPSVHLRYKITPMTNIRFAYTTGLSRPDYWSLAPYKWIFAEDKEIFEGNPDLNPTTSQNLDLMFGHYFQGIGALNLGGFYKAMNYITYEATTQISGGEFDGYDKTQTINGGTANLFGFEVSWMQQFTFLPGFWNGFGIYLNYTYTNSKADLKYRERNVLPGQAGNVGNFGINYEKGIFSGRLSLNYTDPVLVKVGENEDRDRYDDSRLQMDFSGVFRIISNLEFYLDVINITNAPQRQYYGINKPRENQYSDMAIRAGLKFSL